ncbi:hypothetical protein [Rhodovastum atsumiense]|uniref:Uncharacterized protein n=1 Tax=Rhodovastum atsumiense TaxID=504468 RepID=A0A5M6ITM1_9PROT|nr:hypothetical protein [Rhodovastum atsumiense]KAA5611561.1 hypothetical protein F1189_13430 [Rhodovastum atsumiense]
MDALIETVEGFLARNPEMTPTRLGREAVRDPSFVFALRGQGRNRRRPRIVKPETAALVRAFMESWELKKAQGENVEQLCALESEARVAAMAAQRAATAAEAAFRAADAARRAAEAAAQRAQGLRAL